MKLKILTMAYTRPDIIQRSLASLQAPGIEHYILDQHYPLPDYAENRAWLEGYCRDHGHRLLDAGKNLGYHEGINWAIEQMDLADEDIVVNYDPDTLIPVGSESCLSMMRLAFERDKTLAVVGLNNPTIDRELQERGYFDEDVGGLTLRFMKVPVIMSVVAWNVGFIRKVGGLKEPSAMYGGIEATMFPILCREGRRWAVLPFWWEDISLNRQADPEYLEWKHRHGYLQNFPGDFESYLRHIGRLK